MGWKVKTLDNAGLKAAAASLEQMVVDSGFAPDIVVGIASGGAILAELMFQQTKHVEVRCSRPSSGRKSGIIGSLIAILPRAINDRLRILEARLLSRHGSTERTISFGMNAISSISQSNRILIVDDAVDSGATLKAVSEKIKHTAPEATIKSCAITITTDHPTASPDYALFNDNTLIRFPWSADSK